MSDESNSQLPFHRLGPFQVVRPLATGGMAEIFLGRNLGSFDGPETVVLKAWHPPRSPSPFQAARTRNLLSRLLEEGRLGMRLKHPAIARSFGIMHDPELDLYFLVQEYVYGATLTELITYYGANDLRLPYNIILKLMIPVLEALHYAYFNALRDDGRRLRVIHRDIKPDNIMLGFDGRVQVLDFGVAKTTSLTRENTVGTMVVGTRYYMAPEQAYQPEKVGHHTDIFSAGLILYELCCLRSPFEDKNTVRDFALALNDFAFDHHAEAIDTDRYPGIRQVLSRALAVDVSARYRAGADMANDLRSLLELTPAEPRLATFADHLQRDLEAAGTVKDPPARTHDATEDEDPAAGDIAETPTVVDLSRMSWPLPDEDPVEKPLVRAEICRPQRTLSAWDDPPIPTPEAPCDRKAEPGAERPVRGRRAPRPPSPPPEFLPFSDDTLEPPGDPGDGRDDTDEELGAQPLSEIRSLWFDHPLTTPDTLPAENEARPEDGPKSPAPSGPHPSVRSPAVHEKPVIEKSLVSRYQADEPDRLPADNRSRHSPPPAPATASTFSWPALLVGLCLGAAISTTILLLVMR